MLIQWVILTQYQSQDHGLDCYKHVARGKRWKGNFWITPTSCLLRGLDDESGMARVEAIIQKSKHMSRILSLVNSGDSWSAHGSLHSLLSARYMEKDTSWKVHGPPICRSFIVCICHSKVVPNTWPKASLASTQN